ncbi:MAG: head GIN domain-containing protein [Oscillochloridaceae bacterium umkhey_bin13]
MYTLLRLTLLILIGLALSACITINPGLGQIRGSGNVTTETREIGTFSMIDVSGIGKVLITQGDSAALTVETDDNLQAIVLGEVRDDTLYLGIAPNVSLGNLTRMTFNVTVENLTAITLSGAAMISASELTGEQLTVNHSGAGQVTTAGTVVEQHVTLSGAGSYDGAELASERATVDLSGFGSVVVNVSERLDATVSGAGSISYIGKPELHEQVSGMGSIRQRTP